MPERIGPARVIADIVYHRCEVPHLNRRLSPRRCRSAPGPDFVRYFTNKTQLLIRLNRKPPSAFGQSRGTRISELPPSLQLDLEDKRCIQHGHLRRRRPADGGAWIQNFSIRAQIRGDMHHSNLLPQTTVLVHDNLLIVPSILKDLPNR